MCCCGVNNTYITTEVGAWQRGASLHEKRGSAASARHRKWDNLDKSPAVGLLFFFFFFHPRTQVQSYGCCLLRFLTEAFKIIRRVQPQRWMSESHFCCLFCHGKKNQNKTTHRSRIGIAFCEFWNCPCQGLTQGESVTSPKYQTVS